MNVIFPRQFSVALFLGVFGATLWGGASLDEWPVDRFVFSEPHMGTLFQLTIYVEEKEGAQAAATAAFSRVDELNSIMSDYDPGSELMRLTRQPIGIPVAVSADLFEVLWRARKISEISDGAFDVTVGPLVRLWREARARGKLPERELVNAAREAVGYHNLELDPCEQTVTLLAPNMRLDLGGIAKGYAAEEVLKLLQARGLTRVLVAASGDLALGDPPPDREGWRVGIASIDVSGAGVTEALTLRNVAVSTSGDTEQFVEIDEVRYSHIVDPKTGLGLTDRIGVTIVTRDATNADALATAVSILGAEKGMALIESLPGVEALLVKLTAEGREKIESSGFPSL